MENVPKNAPETPSTISQAARGADLCQPGHAWTCTIQCDPGTRYTIERLFNTAGAEVCTVNHCHCAQVPPPPAWTGLPPTGSVQDAGLPLAFVIFGIEHLLRR